MEYRSAQNMELDFLNFDDDARIDTGAEAFSSMNSMNFDLATYFNHPNSTLNNIIKTVLTPLGFQDGGDLNAMPQYNSWSNSDSLNEPSSYFPEMPQQGNQAAISPVALHSPESNDKAPSSAVSEASEVLAKPKRGRPRKSRAKKQLTPQQEYKKRQRFLERNRQAASKCRERRKKWISKQDEKMKQEQAKNAELKTAYDMLNQEANRLLLTLQKHADSGCNKNQLQTFLNSEPGLSLASPQTSGLLEQRISPIATSASGPASDQNSPTMQKLGEMSREDPQGFDAKDSAITNIGSTIWPPGDVAKEEGYIEDDKAVMICSPRDQPLQNSMVQQSQEFDPIVCPPVFPQDVPLDPSIYLYETGLDAASEC